MFEARYRSQCEAGGDMIEPGDMVLYDSDGNLVHEDCNESKLPEDDGYDPFDY